MIFRPGGAQLLVPGLEVWQPAADAPWWMAAGVTPVAAYAPKGAADLASSYINLAGNASFNAAPGEAPTFSALTGWTFNGTTQYLTTGVVAATGWSMFVRFSGASGTGARNVAGASANTTQRFHLIVRQASDHRYGYSGLLTVATSLTAGVMGISGNDCYLDGASEGITTGTAITTNSLYVGARNNNGTADIFYAGDIQAVWISSNTLNAGQVVALTAAMAAL